MLINTLSCTSAPSFPLKKLETPFGETAKLPERRRLGSGDLERCLEYCRPDIFYSDFFISGKRKGPFKNLHPYITKGMHPIRFTRPFWNIRLMVRHTCTETLCNQVHVGVLIVINPAFEGKCCRENSISSTRVNIARYNPACPRGEMGLLVDPDMVVIQDTDFDIEITYPLKRPGGCLYSVHSPNPTTIREILQHVRDAYKTIYRVEEETTDLTVFDIQGRCPECSNTASVNNISMHQVSTPLADDDSKCSICYDTMAPDMTPVVKTPCFHLFHATCLTTWVKRSQTCPLCRQSLHAVCAMCDDSGIVESQYVGTVLPRDLREYPYWRNTTNGFYGIHTADFEDLYIDEIFYNSEKRRVVVKVSSTMRMGV